MNADLRGRVIRALLWAIDQAREPGPPDEQKAGEFEETLRGVEGDGEPVGTPEQGLPGDVLPGDLEKAVNTASLSQTKLLIRTANGREISMEAPREVTVTHTLRGRELEARSRDAVLQAEMYGGTWYLKWFRRLPKG